MQRRLLAAAALLAAAIAAAVIAGGGPRQAGMSAKVGVAARGVAPAVKPAAPPSADLARGSRGAPARPLPDLPASLRDTETDGDLVADDAGHLVVTIETRRLFDYFFSASGEEADEAIVTRIHAAIDERLPAPAAAQARELLARYLEYRLRARELFVAGEEEDVERRLARVGSLRQQVFGERDAAALFGDEEERERFAVEARRRLGDPGLTAEQRRVALEDLDGSMPESVRAERDAALGPLRLAHDEAALRDAGGSPEEIRALRAARFGREAADRLEELDRRRAAWQQRLDAYGAERVAIDADASLTPAQREQRLEELRARHFEAEEVARVRALDEMAPR